MVNQGDLDERMSNSSEMSEKMPSTPSSNQLTVSTVISFSPDDTFDEKTRANKVESLSKSLESVKTTNTDDSGPNKHVEEKWYSVTVQVFIPFMIAGVGTIGAGTVLGEVQEYEVFKHISAIYILVPALLGLKGNLDMCLASRLSTQANLGKMMDSKKEVFKMIVGNVGLVQVQAIVAACLVAIFAVSVAVIVNGEFEWTHSLLLATASVLTATMSCFTLDFILIGMIFLSQKWKLNPDNLATPLAASIGDIVSLVVLSTWATLLYQIHDTHQYIMYITLAVYLFGLLPMWIFIVLKNEYTSRILTHGWTPVLTALIISGMGGLVLDSAVDDYAGFVVFQPIINGIGGNLVSVHSSRISTMLHKTSIPGILPPHTRQWVAPWTALFGGVVTAKTARILLLMSIPGQLTFVFAADALHNSGVTRATAPFVVTYLTVSFVQLMCLLYIAHIMTHTMWRYKIDPDTSAIPYLTAIGDLSGTSLLLVGFVVLRSLDWDYDPVSRMFMPT